MQHHGHASRSVPPGHLRTLHLSIHSPMVGAAAAAAGGGASQHLNGPSAGGGLPHMATAMGMATGVQHQQPPPIGALSTRNHHHHHHRHPQPVVAVTAGAAAAAALHPSANHMQKIRQQHQQMNSSNNNNNHNNVNVNHNKYQHLSGAGGGGAVITNGNAAAPPPGRHAVPTPNLHHPPPQARMPPPYIPPQSAPPGGGGSGHPMGLIMKNHQGPGGVANHVMRQPPPQQQVQPPHPNNNIQRYGSGGSGNNRIKQFYNNNSDFPTPPMILQNPNRNGKQKSSRASTAQGATSGKSNGKASTTTTTPSAQGESSTSSGTPTAKETAAVTPVISIQVAKEVNALGGASQETDGDSNKENAQPEESDDSSNCQPNLNDILSNEDNCAKAKNPREKTPMCMVNELARFNKIQHQYRLTGEKGPAHCKRFTVTLKLGEEEYTSEGFKIKKAQHMAATEALEKTKYKHPVEKTSRRQEDNQAFRANITPTVELNALAMKLGQATYYLFDPRQGPPPDALMPNGGEAMMAHAYGTVLPPSIPPPHIMGGGPTHLGGPPHPPPQLGLPPGHARAMMSIRRNAFAHAQHLAMTPGGHLQNHAHQRFTNGVGGGSGFPGKTFNPRYNMFGPTGGGNNGQMGPLPIGMYALGQNTVPCKVTLIVGKQKFTGVGRTIQHAKHDAASRALEVLKAQTAAAAAASQKAREEAAAEAATNGSSAASEDNDRKSPVSLVHEIAVKRNMVVHFKVLREEGPAHMKNFITACIVGAIATEGQGNGKKISKRRAAEKMLNELRKLPPPTPTKSPVKRTKMRTNSSSTQNARPSSKRNGGSSAAALPQEKSLVEDVDIDADNPVTKLIQYLQSRKEKEPQFELIGRNGSELSRRREFIMEVSGGGKVSRGTGNSKKVAKRNAAQGLLASLLDPESKTDALEEHGGDHPIPVDDKNESTADASNPEAAAVVSEVLPSVTNGLIDVPLVSTSAGQVPGVLILRQNKKHNKKKENPPPVCDVPKTSPHATEVLTKDDKIVMEPSKGSASDGNAEEEATKKDNDKKDDAAVSTVKSVPTAHTAKEEKPSNSSSSSSSSGGVPMKNQLMYLSNLLQFEVTFSNYPKGNHGEFLTIVTLSTNPPQICHGVGVSSDESQNDAAKNALKILSDLGLNNVGK